MPFRLRDPCGFSESFEDPTGGDRIHSVFRSPSFPLGEVGKGGDALGASRPLWPSNSFDDPTGDGRTRVAVRPVIVPASCALAPCSETVLPRESRKRSRKGKVLKTAALMMNPSSGVSISSFPSSSGGAVRAPRFLHLYGYPAFGYHASVNCLCQNTCP